ncbi:MAG: Putative DNA-binding protein in cluster with Type I restriction-modification system [uncultured Campylobacterales bacterium]|uniref:DNA-binding protein in cluster with Type I restriction-modification system n=1 Tax=uncultured Campylobacterales bacterium TaxID=352960 RepID=A0A6S6S6H9_9BACT|nr:MAG: Putative DNA-binding protein in cluster with Type I restriction-modification system [uncultured Campylobacterales bacterium]
MKPNPQISSEVITYSNGELDVSVNKDTVWLTQKQIVEVFNKDQSVISRHINNIFKDKEVDEKSNMQKMHIPN